MKNKIVGLSSAFLLIEVGAFDWGEQKNGRAAENEGQ